MSQTVKPSQSEEEYFAREEVQKKKMLANMVRSRYEQEERDTLKRIHWLHCPKCGMEMHSVAFKGIFIDKCFECGAVALEEADLNKLTEDEGNILSGIMNLFR